MSAREELRMVKQYITAEEICVKRSPADFSAWVQAKIHEIALQPEGKSAIRLRKGLCKVLVEELYAMSIWAGHVFSKHDPVLLEPVLGNQNYDALVTDLSGSPPVIRRLETTQAHGGEEDYLRNLMLDRAGWAWASAKLEKKGTKKAGIHINVKQVLTAYNEHLSRAIQLIRKAITRKSKNHYLDNTDLLVMFEDNFIVREFPIIDSLNMLFDEKITKMTLPFSRVYFTGWSKQTFLARDI